MKLRDIVLYGAIGASALGYGCSSAPERVNTSSKDTALEPFIAEIVHVPQRTDTFGYPSDGFNFTYMRESDHSIGCGTVYFGTRSEAPEYATLIGAITLKRKVRMTPEGYRRGCVDVESVELLSDVKPEADPHK